MATMSLKPFEVEITRGLQVESRHIVHAVVYTPQESHREIYGDGTFSTFPRSALKPIQALPLLMTGAAQHYQVTEEELALACASHRGEPMHVDRVRAWLKRIGCNETDLECGTHPPANQESLFDLIKAQGQPSAAHNNCSGKHTGMLTTAKHLGEPLKNYVTLIHPVQQRIKQYIEQFCGVALNEQSFGVDGCSIPAPAMPLINLAKGFGEWAAPSKVDENTAEACKQLFKACVKHPLLTAGTGHFCSDLMIATQGQVLVKGGAEGVVIAAIPELKMGIALKTVDGNSRAADFCLSVILQRLGLLSATSPLLTPKIYNWNKIETGAIRLK